MCSRHCLYPIILCHLQNRVNSCLEFTRICSTKKPSLALVMPPITSMPVLRHICFHRTLMSGFSSNSGKTGYTDIDWDGMQLTLYFVMMVLLMMVVLCRVWLPNLSSTCHPNLSSNLMPRCSTAFTREMGIGSTEFTAFFLG